MKWMCLDFQLAQFCKTRLSIRIELSVQSAQNDKDKEKGTDAKQEGNEKGGN